MKFAFGIIAAGLLSLAIALPGYSQTTKRAIKAANPAQIAHGEYLVKSVAGCGDCHSPMNNKGEPLQGQWLKGSKLSFGPLMPFPGWAAVSPSIAGLHGWDTKDAMKLLMTGLDPKGQPPRPPMPQYHMNRADAAAVVAYLKSLK